MIFAVGHIESQNATLTSYSLGDQCYICYDRTGNSQELHCGTVINIKKNPTSYCISIFLPYKDRVFVTQFGIWLEAYLKDRCIQCQYLLFSQVLFHLYIPGHNVCTNGVPFLINWYNLVLMLYYRLKFLVLIHLFDQSNRKKWCEVNTCHYSSLIE